MQENASIYFTSGCGRCAFGGTPQCKVHRWPKELALLRQLALDCGLAEELKWGMPCYVFQKSNVAMVCAFKDYCAISFFKGSLLNDADKLLSKPGENTQAARLIKFTDYKTVVELKSTIKAYIFEAIEIEKAGLKVDYDKNKSQEIPEEFADFLKKDATLKKAFYNLTPGRQRAYIINFTAPKQSKTRIARIQKCVPMILAGRGLND